MATLRQAVVAVRVGYASQAKFADVEAASYFREFIRRLDGALSAEGWTTAPPEGEMFIWAYRKDDGGWGTGLGYWTVTPGQWRDASNWNGDAHRRATHFHPMPEPPK